MDSEPESLILLPRAVPRADKANCLNGFWRWVALLADDDYQGAVRAIRWPDGTPLSPEDLKHRITAFFGGDAQWFVVIPNERLVRVINDAATCQPPNKEGRGWFMAQIPLTTEPADQKNDEIPLMGLAASFFVYPHHGNCVMEFEIFHL